MPGSHLDKINQSKHKPKHPDQQPAEHQHKPFRLEDADVMDLQRTIGNQGVQNVMGRPAIQRQADVSLPALPGVVQAKMSVNEPGDQYEQEADSVAHEVMTMADPLQREPIEEEEEMLMEKPLQRQDELPEEELMGKFLQRQPMEEEDEMLMEKPLQRQDELPEEELMGKFLQRQPMEEEEMLMEKPLQREETPGVSAAAEAAIEGARGSGDALPDDARNFLEPRFGQDFSDVRVHTGAEANDLNDAVQARAFTTGSDIFFRDGEYNPNSDAGKELLAHELTHVVQQGGGKELKAKHDDEGCC